MPTVNLWDIAGGGSRSWPPGSPAALAAAIKGVVSVSGALAAPVPLVAPTITGPTQINSTTLRVGISGGSGATSWTLEKSTNGFTTWTSAGSVTVGATQADATVTTGQSTQLRIAASAGGSPVYSNVVTGVAGVSVTTIYSQDFESGTQPTEWQAYNGSSITMITDTAQTYNGSAGALKANYPQPTGNVYVMGSVNVSAYTAANNEVYIDFYAKMPNSKQGLKFCKLFGGNNAGAYANMTFGLDYTGVDRGGMVYVAFGDGSSTSNDSQNGVWLDGTNKSWAGRSYGLAGFNASTPQNKNFHGTDWGTGWHRFQLRAKFNSGTTAANEVNDGEIDVIIDGVTYVAARGLFNRHYSNQPLDHIHFFEYAQTGTSAFDIWIDSIRVSQNGWTR